MSQRGSPIDTSSPHSSNLTTDVISPKDESSKLSTSRRTSNVTKKTGRTLTAAQLEKKRANDREAQRAIRERTKSLIEGLEKKIKELERGEAYQQLQNALREKQAVEAENAELRNRLASILEVLRPVFPSEIPLKDEAVIQSSSRIYTNGTRESSAAPIGHSAQSSVTGRIPSGSGPTSYTSHPASADSRSNATSIASTSWEHQRADHWDRKVQPARSTETPSSERSHNPQSMPHKSITKKEHNPAYPPRQSTFYGTTTGSFVPLNGSPATEKTATPNCSAIPQNLGTTCHFDRIIYDFTTAGRRNLAQGQSLNSICGGERPTLNYLAEQRPPKQGEEHYLSVMLTDLLKGFSAITGLPEKIAIVEISFEYIRWLISPNEETYNAVPMWMRPVPEQLRIPHPVWVDFLPWPTMRKRMVYDYPGLPLEHFFQPYCQSIALAYNGRDLDACLICDPHTHGMFARQELLSCVWQLDCWSLGHTFAETYPSLAEDCRIKGP